MEPTQGMSSRIRDFGFPDPGRPPPIKENSAPADD